MTLESELRASSPRLRGGDRTPSLPVVSRDPSHLGAADGRPHLECPGSTDGTHSSSAARGDGGPTERTVSPSRPKPGKVPEIRPCLPAVHGALHPRAWIHRKTLDLVFID